MACFGVSQRSGDLPLDAEQVIICELLLDGVLAQNGKKIAVGGRLRLLLLLSSRRRLRRIFLSDELIDFLFEIDGAGMAGEGDLAPLVNKTDKGNATNGKILDQSMIILPSL